MRSVKIYQQYNKSVTPLADGVEEHKLKTEKQGHKGTRNNGRGEKKNMARGSFYYGSNRPMG